MNKPGFITRFETAARRKRHLLFAELLSQVERPLTVLDVGGTYEYWARAGYSDMRCVRFVLFNTFQQDGLPVPFLSQVGDARDLSRYGDAQFDVVFSNSVLGHVGAFEDQRRMASEIRRVGKRYFLQTPNQRFPIDWRTLVPFFHFLPASIQAWCFQKFRVGAYGRAGSRVEALNLATRVRNLCLAEMRILFPGATIVHERIVGFTKSFMVHSGFAVRAKSDEESSQCVGH